MIYCTEYCWKWLQIKEQLAKANCSTKKNRERLPCVHSIDVILDSIQGERDYFLCKLHQLIR
ncbi:hypothetical protein CWB33_27820 [Bacillus cereus]|nr:hypothetical protein DY470_13295 [Bacillus anthracis]MBR9658772.1 hypothetical protein [Bacillus cereus]